MKIAIIGNQRPPHSTENDWRRAFTALGHDVTFFQEDTDDVQNLNTLRRELLALHPAALMYVRTWGLPRDAVQLWRELEAAGIRTFAAHLDRFFGLDRAHIVNEDPMFRVSYYFSADGDYDAEFAAAGVNHHWLPPGVNAAECYDAEPDPERWPYKVAFVGSAPQRGMGNYHEEWPHRVELVEHLRAWYGRDFVHVGNGGTLGNNYPEPNYRGATLNQFYATVPVIVGDSCLVRADGRYISDRVFETWGRGGFLIHPRVDWLVEEFGPYPGSDWIPGKWDKLRECIDAWSAAPYDRERTRHRIAAVVRTRHTYTQRACEMLQVMGFDCQEEAA